MTEVGSVQYVDPAVTKKTPELSKSPVDTAQAFLSAFESAISKKDVSSIVDLFADNGWWRDMLVVDTTDFNTLQKGDIKEALGKFGVPKIHSLKVDQPLDAAITKVSEELTWLSAFFTFETDQHRGKGFIRLIEPTPGSGSWKAFTFYSALWEIKGHEEFSYDRRPLGTFHGQREERKNWLDHRKEAVKFEKTDPTVLIIGASQNGLMLGARLFALGIPTLLVEKNDQVGDSWAKRYHSLVLHDPVFSDHFPYISYPPTWPIYTPKDKLAAWMRSYAEAMELNVWCKSTIEANPAFDEAKGEWTVKVLRDGQEPRTMKVRHIVMCTGFSGEPRLPSFPRDEFQGTVVHSSQHKGAMEWKGKKAVVIGCCNSGHDIAADFYEQGADITIVQRSSTYVMSSEHGIPALLNGFYQEGGPPLADADLMLASLPVNLLEQFHIGATKQIAEKDKVILEDLQKAGFKLNPYPGGLFIKYFRDGGGYYIDVGASRLIADGKIKIKQGVEIEKLTKDGVLFADGQELKADIVVMATGYTSMRETVRRLINGKVADSLGPTWGADAQGEIPSMWRNSGHPRFWLQAGNMFQARVYSKWVALQIQMQELGQVPDKNTYPEWKTVRDGRF